MNKKTIEKLIPKAYELICESGLNNGEKLSKTYRGYIATFGAAITMGSLLAAVAFYIGGESDKENGTEKEPVKNRPVIMRIIYALIADKKYEETKSGTGEGSLYYYVLHSASQKRAKQEIYDAAIALKLAMNMFDLVKE